METEHDKWPVVTVAIYWIFPLDPFVPVISGVQDKWKNAAEAKRCDTESTKPPPEGNAKAAGVFQYAEPVKK